MAKFLVTGAAGFIGRSIAAALLARGETVRGVDNLITGRRENLIGLEQMEFIEGDLADPAVCARSCAGVEIVFHEAALASVPRSVADPVATNVSCVDATLNLLVAARAAGVRRVIYAGSSAAYGDSPELPKHEGMLPNPITPYAVAKLADVLVEGRLEPAVSQGATVQPVRRERAHLVHHRARVLSRLWA